MSHRSPLPVPLIRKPKSLGSPSFRDVNPEHKYIIRFNRRVQLQQRASKPFKRMFTRERVQERECREQIQEDVVDYRAMGQSPKRKAVEAVGIRRTLTRSTCSLPRRAMSAAPAPFFVGFDEAMDVDTDEDDSMDVDDVPQVDCDVEMEDATTPPVYIINPWLVYHPFVPPRPSPPPPPPAHIPTPAQAMPTAAPSFPPHVPAAQVPKASAAAGTARAAAAPAANGSASACKAAWASVRRNPLLQQFLAFDKASGRGRTEAPTPAPAATAASPAKERPAKRKAGPSDEETEKKTSTKSGRLRRKRAAANGDN